MDQIKMKRRYRLLYGSTPPALWIGALAALCLLLCILSVSGQIAGADLALALGLTAAATALCQGLRRLGDGRLGFLGVLVLAAVIGYMCVELVSLGDISWLSEETPLLHLVGFPWVLGVFLLALAG